MPLTPLHQGAVAEGFPHGRPEPLAAIHDHTPFEDEIATERVGGDEVLRLLDYPAYFDLLERPLPSDRNAILAALGEDRLIRRRHSDSWDILHLGAILFAKRLDAFHALRRKAVRVIQYRGAGRTETLREQEGGKGYASGFEGLVGYINGLLPANEVIEQALRRTVPMFPELAVRELVANALIHQDLFVSGAGPMVEIFDDRIEITNPGEPLVDTRRFVDTPPKSRNEALASLMRRFRICEERGSGIDSRVSGRAVPTASAAVRETGRFHAGRTVCSQRTIRHGPGGAGGGQLSSRLSQTRDARLLDQRIAAREIRRRGTEQSRRLALYPRDHRCGSHQTVR